jgi:hypothetical protein
MKAQTPFSRLSLENGFIAKGRKEYPKAGNISSQI